MFPKSWELHSWVSEISLHDYLWTSHWVQGKDYAEWKFLGFLFYPWAGGQWSQPCPLQSAPSSCRRKECSCLTTWQLRCCHPKLGTWKLADKDHIYLRFLTIVCAVIPYSLVPRPTLSYPETSVGSSPVYWLPWFLAWEGSLTPRQLAHILGWASQNTRDLTFLEWHSTWEDGDTHRTKKVDPQEPEPWAHSNNLFNNPFFTGLLHSLLLVLPWDHLLNQLSAVKVLFHFRELRSSPTSEFQRGFEMSVTSNWKPFLKAISVTK